MIAFYIIPLSYFFKERGIIQKNEDGREEDTIKNWRRKVRY
jgi:hypothetical protein